jgi:hypothetical protein
VAFFLDANNVKCQVGVKIAGQIQSVFRATIWRGISGQVRADRSELLMPAKVCGPGNRMPGQSNWVSFVMAMAANSERGLS